MASTIKTFNPQPIHLIVGLIKTKSPSQFLAPLKKYIKSLSAIEIPETESSYRASEIFSVAREIGFKTDMALSVEHAISKIVHKEKSTCKIIICGSLYLAGSVLRDNQ